jgi:type II restriction/modification system DNA methylase subunit YeeA
MKLKKINRKIFFLFSEMILYLQELKNILKIYFNNLKIILFAFFVFLRIKNYFQSLICI